MATTVFPEPSAASGGSDTLAKTISVASPMTPTYGSGTFSPGTYTITCASSTIATVSFFGSNNALIGTAVTASGTVLFNLASAATSVSVFTNTGSNIVVNIQLTGSAITSATSGTLVTLTNSQTYTETGRAYAVVVAGGANGNAGNNANAGNGGVSGGITSGIVGLTGSTAVIIGAGGGGSTSIGNITANTGGTGSGAGGGSSWTYNSSTVGSASSVPEYTFVKNGTTGGGGGTSVNIGRAGGGSGIGTGGQGAGGNTGGAGAGSGYGAGGGAGSLPNAGGDAGGAGSQGVVYLIKF